MVGVAGGGGVAAAGRALAPAAAPIVLGVARAGGQGAEAGILQALAVVGVLELAFGACDAARGRIRAVSVQADGSAGGEFLRAVEDAARLRGGRRRVQSAARGADFADVL